MKTEQEVKDMISSLQKVANIPILTADDEEGNGFHQIPYSFCNDKELLETAIEGTNYEANEIIILG